MKKVLVSLAWMALVASAAFAADAKPAASGPEWSMNATAIEACSCPMFCQCYFNAAPAGHGGGHEGHGEDHFCRFNNAYKVNKGMYGATKLDGAKFWIYGDLGGDFSQGKMDWATVVFDKSTTKEQREAIGAIAGRLFPVSWTSLTTGEGDISWTAGKDEATAMLDGGKTAEVHLTSANLNRNVKAEPAVLKNIRYWGAGKNDGFIMMPNTLNTLRTGDKAFEFKGTNGFMITFDVDSKTAPPAAVKM